MSESVRERAERLVAACGAFAEFSTDEEIVAIAAEIEAAVRDERARCIQVVRDMERPRIEEGGE